MDTTFSSWLRTQAYDTYTNYQQHECKALEVYAFEGTSTIPTHKEIPAAQLDDWLYTRGSYSVPNHASNPNFVGGMRILLQQWDDDDLASNVLIPFQNQEMFDKVLSALRLPAEYPYHLRHNIYVPPKVITTNDSTTNRTFTTTIFQSPRFTQTFMTMALSYDSETRITSGFLAYVNIENKLLLPSILHAAADAYHPLLLPILVFDSFVRIIRVETRSYNRERADIGKVIFNAAKKSPLDSVNFPDIHERLIDSHNTLTSALAPFIEESCVQLRTQLKRVSLMISPEAKADVDFNAKTQELERCMDQLHSVATDLMNLRKGIITRMDMHLKALYTLMQTRDSAINRQLAQQSTEMTKQSAAIAEATQKDSAAMKAIAIVTMVFLPGTAISTMFSMSVFFNAKPDGTISMNPSIWIFWAVTIPLTLAVLGIWTAWQWRDDLKAHWGKEGAVGLASMFAPWTSKPGGRTGPVTTDASEINGIPPQSLSGSDTTL